MEQNREMSETLHEVVEKIVKEYRPEKIILFGSYAWGTPTEGSDIDLFIVKDTKGSSREMARAINRFLSPRQFPLDILVYTPSEVERNLFIEDVIQNGTLLYAQ